MTFNPVLTIQAKRDGRRLSDEQIAAFIDGYVRGDVPDYQMAALAMAVYFRGMDPAEIAALTGCMLRSGATLSFPGVPGPFVDKHSTGGVGDKVSLLLAPMLACCGLRVPMISGRGLGATGGTLDKLDSIPGFRTRIPVEEIRRLVGEVGIAMAGQTEDLVPADRKLYALRDVTATVPSIPLITASIMSKKLAEGLDALVLDVKWGSGAFMKTLDAARDLAASLVRVGRLSGVKTTALLTDMNQPLGRMAGHVVEVLETIDGLQGRGPADLMELTVALGAELLVTVGAAADLPAASARLQETIASGAAMAKFREMVAAQGGRLDELPGPAAPVPVTADRSGWVAGVDAERIGIAIITLGGGRMKTTDAIDYTVGVEMKVRIGDRVDPGTPLARVFAGERGVPEALEMVRRAITLSDTPVPAPTLIVEAVR
jgi:pyrimidine-nucleoside phosphorylase